MKKIMLIMLVVFANVTLGHWWLSAAFIEQYGIGFLVLLALFQTLLLSALLQAERTLVYVIQEQDAPKSNRFASIFSGKNYFLYQLFIICCFVASVLSAAHNLIVLSWHLNGFSEIFLQSYTIEDFPFLLNRQELVFGGVGTQMVWLTMVSVVFIFFTSGVIAARSIVMPFFNCLLTFSMIVFVMLFFWQNESNISFDQIQLNSFDVINMITSAASLAIESTLSGVGIFFVLKFVFRWDIQQSFLGLSVIVLVIVSSFLAVCSWVLVEETGITSLGFFADRLLLLTPLYMNSLLLAKSTSIIWMVSVVSLVVIKTILLSSVCWYIIKVYFPYLPNSRLFASMCVVVLAFFGFVLILVPSNITFDDAPSLFEDMFVQSLYYLYPFQIALLCWLAFSLPPHVHSNLMPVENRIPWLDHAMCWYYLLLSLLGFLWGWYRFYLE